MKQINKGSFNLRELFEAKPQVNGSLKNISLLLSFSLVSCTLSYIKPDFHSRFFFVASEIFRTGHAQGGETNRTGRKNIFCSVRIWSSNISTSAKFSHGETNQTSFLSHVDISRGSKNFHKMAAPQLCQA